MIDLILLMQDTLSARVGQLYDLLIKMPTLSTVFFLKEAILTW